MFKDTNLFFLKEDILREFNNGKSIYEQTEHIYKEFKTTAGSYEDKAVIHHLTANLFPTMAYYKALIANGYDTDMALFHVRKETKKYGCPELCTVFCENDDIAFCGLMPKIRFERTGTLGQGADKCDFHFINAKRSSERK